jgi:hypothetical protein
MSAALKICPGARGPAPQSIRPAPLMKQGEPTGVGVAQKGTVVTFCCASAIDKIK